jgi:4a-hydroxytetrahydrobiopterin dehydratase
MATISEPEARERLGKLPGWTLFGHAIRRQYSFAGFADAVAFVARLAFDAEAADHHPGISVDYRRVTLTYTTHSEGGLTAKDFAGAAAADTLAKRMGGT